MIRAECGEKRDMGNRVSWDESERNQEKKLREPPNG